MFTQHNKKDKKVFANENTLGSALREKTVRCLKEIEDQHSIFTNKHIRRIIAESSSYSFRGVLAKKVKWQAANVLCIAELPSEKRGIRLVTGSDDFLLRIWDLNTSTMDNLPVCMQELQGHTSYVTCVATLRSHEGGNRIVSGSWDSSLRIWDLDKHSSTGQYVCIQELKGHTDWIECVVELSAHKGESRLVSGSDDYSLRIWGLQKGTMGVQYVCLQVLKGHTGNITCVAVIPSHEEEEEGCRIVSGDEEHSLRIWDLDKSTGYYKCAQVLKVQTGWVRCVVAFSLHDGAVRLVAGSSEGSFYIWDQQKANSNYALTKEFKSCTGSVMCMTTMSPHNGGTRFVSGGRDYSLRIWNLDRHKKNHRYVCLKNMKGNEDWVMCVLQLSNGLLASCAYDNKLCLWE